MPNPPPNSTRSSARPRLFAPGCQSSFSPSPYQDCWILRRMAQSHRQRRSYRPERPASTQQRPSSYGHCEGWLSRSARMEVGFKKKGQIMNKTLHGKVHGRTIQLDQDPGVAERQEVEVQMTVVEPKRTWGDGIQSSAGGW